MADINNVKLELTVSEAELICRALQGYNPPQSEEMISYFLYSRIIRRVEEAKNEKKA